MGQISVVIPVHNHSSRLADAISSVLSQGDIVADVCVIDDASSDDSVAVARTFDDPRLSVVEFESQRGANAARNAGIARTSAPFVAFLDSDDRFLSGHLEALQTLLLGKPGLCAAHASFVSVVSGGTFREVNPDIELSADRLDRVLVAHALPITNSALMVRRTALQQAAGFDEALFRQQDRDLMLRLGKIGALRFSSAVTVEKHQLSNSMSRDSRNYILELEKLVNRHPVFGDPANAELLCYLTGRMMLKNLISGRWSILSGEWSAYRHSTLPQYGMPRLCAGYWRGRTERQSVRDTLYKDALPG